MAKALRNVFLACVFLTFVALFAFSNSVNEAQKQVQSGPTTASVAEVISNSTGNSSGAIPLFPYTKNPTTICDSFKTFQGTKLLVLVKSSPDNLHLREWIRYKNNQQDSQFKDSVKTVFLLGKSATSDKSVDTESKHYGDIVQGDFIDAYRNLTHKTIMGYRWTAEFCAHSDFVVYKDDDFKINLANIMKHVKSQKDPQSVFIGFLIKNGKIIYRDPKHKWYLSKQDYPHNILPPYFPGGAYLVSTSIAKNLASNFHKVKWLPIDDVYIGLTAQTVKIGLTHSALFNLKDCKNYQRDFACREFGNPDEVLSAWRTLTLKNLERTKT